MSVTTRAEVPADRLGPWLAGFRASHGQIRLDLVDGNLSGAAEDGSSFVAAAPFSRLLAEATCADLIVTCEPPPRWGILLVRKGGFAVAAVAGYQIEASKVGSRHVQGRTKAGGQSQQRFARRRANQAQAAYAAASAYAADILPPGPLVVGGDRGAVREVLAQLPEDFEVVGHWLDVPDPRRAILESAVIRAASVRMSVVNA